MRTTVRLDAALMTKVKAEATRRGETLTALIERGFVWYSHGLPGGHVKR